MTLKDTKSYLEHQLNDRLPTNFKSHLIFDENEVVISFFSAKTSIHIITPFQVSHDSKDLESLEKIILKFINGRFYK